MGYARIKREVQQAKVQTVVIGIQEGTDNPESDVSVAQYGFWNEYGTKNKRIPERSFMRSTFDEKSGQLLSQMNMQYGNVLAGRKTIRQALSFVGMVHETDIKTKIRDLKIPPNAEYTIKKKKSDNPLIDTGTMRNSIRYVIRHK